LILLGLSSAPALAFEPAPGTSPADAFRVGYAAYQNGDLPAAVDALTYAAERGNIRAKWLLGRMYANGQGVTQDDDRAFGFFADIAEDHRNDNPAGADAPFVADALVALGNYYREGGIAAPIADREQARQLYLHAATYFADPTAQYNLAAMFYAGEIGAADPVQAARWARLAAENGSPQAQGLLGHLLFEGEGVTREPVLGLAYLTIAFMRRPPGDTELLHLHEQAFSVATEADRRTALALAETWLVANGGLTNPGPATGGVIMAAPTAAAAAAPAP
jgi:TPR repeat protein